MSDVSLHSMRKLGLAVGKMIRDMSRCCDRLGFVALEIRLVLILRRRTPAPSNSSERMF